MQLCTRLSQRYCLALMCMIGLALDTMNRWTFNLLVKEMSYTDRTKTKPHACPQDQMADLRSYGMEEFLWGLQIQVFLLTSHSLGHLLGRLPLGLVTDRCGAKTLFGYSVFIPGVCSILTPLCARTSPYVMIANRVLMGIFSSAQFPAVAWLAARWFPYKEMSFMLNIMLLGLPLGSVGQFFLVHQLMDMHHSWAAPCYVNGALAVLWAYLWQAFFWEDPFEHPCISRAELELLVDKIPMYANDTELEPGWSWPWKAIITSCSLWTLMMASLGFSLVQGFAVVMVPTLYFPDVHNYEFTQHEAICTLLFLLMSATMLTAGVVCDKLINLHIFNLTHILKLYFSISSVLGSTLFIGLTHSGCNLTTVYLYYIAAIVCTGFATSGIMHACINIAPNFAATTFSLVTLVSLAVRPIQVKIEEGLTSSGSLRSWQTASYLNAAVSISATAIFLKAGNCQPMRWNEPKYKKTREIDYEVDQQPTPGGKSEKVELQEPGQLGEKNSQPSQYLETRPTESAMSRRISRIISAHSLSRLNKSRSQVSKRKGKQNVNNQNKPLNDDNSSSTSNSLRR